MPALFTLVSHLSAISRRYTQLAFLVLLAAFACCQGQTSGTHHAPALSAFEAPLSFEPNVGQFDDAANSPTRYIAHGRGFLLRLEPSRAVIELYPPSGKSSPSRLAFNFVGSNPEAPAIPTEPLKAKHSYFPSSDTKSWRRAVPTFARVNYQGLYPGIDMSFYGQSGRLEYDLVVKPGSDPGSIALALEGAQQVHIEDDGSLSLGTQGSEMKLLKPVAYQQASDNSARKLVEVSYVLQPSDALHRTPGRLSFHLGEYDHSKPLIIDPVLIAGIAVPALAGYAYPPYYYANTVVSGMTVDAAGNIYVATASTAYNFPYGVLKFSPSGELLLNVSLGSANVAASPDSIAVDGAGDIYLAGSSAAGLPTTQGAFQPSSATSGQTPFLTVIKADGSALLYSTYLGGSSGGNIAGVALDGNGKAYVTGTAYGDDFPTTPGSYQPSVSSTEGAAEFVAKLDPSKSGAASLVYSTYLYPTPNYYDTYSFATSIAVDEAGSAYVGSTATDGFPVTSGAYAFNGVDSSGGYVTKLSPDGSALAYSAYLGPGVPNAIAVDGSGAAYVAGVVSSAEFPTTPGAYQLAYPGGFAAKLTPGGSSLVYSTFLSGPSGYSSNSFTANKIALYPGCTSACNALVSGTTTAADLPLINAIQSFAGTPGQVPVNEQYASGFLVGLAADGKSALLSTYLGPATSATYSVGGVAFDSSADIYYAANTQGPDAPLTAPPGQNAGEGFILKIGLANAGRAIAIPDQLVVATPQAVHSTNVAAGTIQLRNMGSQAVTLTRPFSFSSAEFAETDHCGSSLAGGGICTLNISFAPAASGTRSAELSVASSGVVSPAIVSLSGTGVDAPNLSVSALSLGFADQIVGSAGAAQTVTLANTGDQPQPLLALTSSLSDYMASSTCPAQLSPQTSCSIGIRFSPTQIGLRTGQVFLQLPGYSNGYANGVTISLTGSGVLSSTGTGSLTFSTSGMNFGSIVLGSGTASQTTTLVNTGDTPVTINSIAVTTKQGAAGDFSLNTAPSAYSYSFCGGSAYSASVLTFPYELAAQSSCEILVDFQPSNAEQETGSIEVASSASGGPQVASLSGIGLHSVQALTVEPGKLVFPPQPVGDPSAIQTFTISNNGNDFVVLDRATTSGDFPIAETDTFSCEGATLGPLESCTLSILFNPTAVGARSGTLTLVDTLTGAPQVFNLTGTAIQATGALVLGQTSLTFPSQVKGTTSSEQELIVSNPGNSPVTINNVVATGDFAIATSYNQACGGALAPASTCQIEVVFSPTKSSGTETGVLTVHSTTGNLTVNLSGPAVAAAQAVHLTASSVSFGSVQVGTATGFANEVTVYIENTGNEPITFSAPPAFSAPSPTPAGDFALAQDNCYPYLPEFANETSSPLQPGQSCTVTLSFTPSLQATETGTMTLTGSAGTETLALTGKGVATVPAVTLQPATLSMGPSIVGLPVPPYNTYAITFSNNSNQPATINSVTVTAGSSDFSISTIFGSCAGQTLYPNSSCTAYVLFQPSARGYRTGKITFVDGNGNSYSAGLAGYGQSEVNAVSLTPQALVLPSVAVQEPIDPYYFNPSVITLANNGNAPLIVGTVTGTNISSGGDFSITSPGGYDYCSGSTVGPGQYCQTTVSFTPQKTGKRTGSLQYPVTYADNTTASFTATLSGVGLSAVNSANLLPQTAAFAAQVAGFFNQSYQNQVDFVLTNAGTIQMTVGVLAGTDLASSSGAKTDFLVTYDSCSNTTLVPGAKCNFDVSFTPFSPGQKAGTVALPVTYAGGATASFTSTLSGSGTAPAPALLVTPTSLSFNVEVAGTTDTTNVEATQLSSVGNVPVTLTSVSASKNFTVQPNSCSGSFSAPFSCFIAVAFTPSAATPPGVVNGTLTIVDNAPGSPHLVKLSGTVISAAAQLALSQTSVSFGNQPVSTSSLPQVVYLTDLGTSSSRAQINSIQLGGTNAGDFTETENCGGTLGFSIGGRQGCMIFVSFAPAAGSLGTRTASVTITPAQGPPLVIQLIGQGVNGSSSQTSSSNP